MSNHTYCHHLKHEPQALIDCVQAQCDGQDPYPVLHIGDATFWPSRGQLVAIRDAIQGYLDAHLGSKIAAESEAVAEHAARCGNCNTRYTATWIGTTCSVCDGTIVAQTPEYTEAEIQEMF